MFQKFLSFYGKPLLLWLLFFTVARTLFLIFNNYFVQDGVASLNIYFYALKMDLSMSCYIVGVLGLLAILLALISQKWAFSFLKWAHGLCFIGFGALYCIDILMYKEWGFRLDTTFFSYLDNTGEAANFVATKIVLIFCLMYAILLATAYFAMKYFWILADKYSVKTWLALFLFLPVFIIPIRGGFDVAPMSPASVYFSPNMKANHAAINPIWNLFFHLSHPKTSSDAYQYFPSEEAKNLLDSLNANTAIAIENYIEKDSIKHIVFVILESFTANMVDLKKEGKEVTPCLNQLRQNGIYFTKAYAAGDRTDKGLVALLSCFPAQPTTSIMLQASKVERLPSLLSSLKDFETQRFYYGGNINFAGMKAFLYGMGLDHIIDKDSFPSSAYNAKWGVHDHLIFKKLAADLRQTTSKSIQIVLSLSSHPPYDVPMPTVFQGSDEENQFLNAAHYTDQSLQQMLHDLKSTDQYKNTLIVITADHGNRFPGNLANHEVKKFHIPIYLGGGVVKKAQVFDHIVSQLDLGFTIASLASNEPHLNQKFPFAKSLFQPKNPYAYYCYNNGYGFIATNGSTIVDLNTYQLIDSCRNCILDGVKYGKVVLQNTMEIVNK